METAEIGSISSGTMRKQDLIPCFLGALEDLVLLNDNMVEITTAIEERIKFADNEENHYDYYESEASDFDLEELFDALNDYAPENCYFGANPGDGADYGFWQAE